MKASPLPLGARLLLALALATAGCDTFLDRPVLGQYEAGTFFANDANAVLAVNAAYVPLSFRDPASNPIWVLADVASDDAVKGGNPGDQADFDNIDQFNITPLNAAVEAEWKRLYDGVYRCNVVTDGLPEANAAVSAAVRRQALGQAQFLRAWYYFQLTALYGRVPLRVAVGTPLELQSPARDQADIYAQVERDCRAAAAALPPRWTGPDAGRATRGAAQALLAKACLYQQKWALAAQMADSARSQGYQLLPVYGNNFRTATKNNPEVIFAALHESNFSPSQGNALNQWFAPRALNGYAFLDPTRALVGNYETAPDGTRDPRLDYTLARQGRSYFDLPYDTLWSTTGLTSKKHAQPLAEVPNALKGEGGLNTNLIRLADVLLVQAEALNEAGRSAEALVPLNLVRKRARESFLFDPALPGAGAVPPGLLPDIATTDPAVLRGLIRRERRAEMALEFQRFFDVIRYGEAYARAALANRPNFNYGRHKFFPVPQSERDTNGKLGL